MSRNPDRRYVCTVECPDCHEDKFKVYERPQPNKSGRGTEPGFWMNEQEFIGERCDTKFCQCGCVLERRVGATDD